MFLPSEFYVVFCSTVSMGSMRKWSLKNLEEIQDSSHMTGQKKKGRNELDTCECTEVRLRALYPHKKRVRERDVGTRLVLLSKICATFCHENFQGKTSSGSLRIMVPCIWEKIGKEWMDFQIIGIKTWNPCEQSGLCAEILLALP